MLFSASQTLLLAPSFRRVMIVGAAGSPRLGLEFGKFTLDGVSRSPAADIQNTGVYPRSVQVSANDGYKLTTRGASCFDLAVMQDRRFDVFQLFP